MDDRTALSNLFRPEAPASIAATVTGRIATGRYSLTDDAGRTIQADSGLVWTPGSRVTVQAGRIVAAAGATTIRTYEV